MGEQSSAADIANRVEPITSADDRHVIVGGQVAVRRAGIQPDPLQSDVGRARCSPGGDHDLVHLERRSAGSDRGWAAVDPADASVPYGRPLDRFHPGVEEDRDAEPAELVSHQRADERLLPAQQGG